MPPEVWRPACQKLARLPHEHEARLTGLLAAMLASRPEPVEHWAACVLTSRDEEAPPGAGPAVGLFPRSDTREMFAEMKGIQRVLRAPPLPGRLDVLLEADLVVGVSSCDLAPALPVTRAQAGAMHLPARLLFAKGAAFASVGAGPVDARTLEAAWVEHRRVLHEHLLDLAEACAVALEAGAAGGEDEDDDLAGVILSLGDEARVATVVPRVQAARLCAGHPALARRIAARVEGVLPIVVWAAGHLSVQTRLEAAERYEGETP
jgi:hypothetical protein